MGQTPTKFRFKTDIKFPVTIYFKDHPQYETELRDNNGGEVLFLHEWLTPQNTTSEWRPSSNAGGTLKSFIQNRKHTSCNGWMEWIVKETQQPIDSLREPVSREGDSMTTEQSTFLLTWNPKNYSLIKQTGESGQEEPYSVDDEIRWACSSKQPNPGDTVYLIRLGEEPRGIVAKGTVTKKNYSDSDWLEPEKQKQYIDFRFDDIRLSCDQGLVPMMMLERLFPEQKWSPQSSGISIKPEYLSELGERWKESTGKHSIETVLRWCLESVDWGAQWITDYQETCGVIRKIAGQEYIQPEDLKKIWYEKSNGIAGVGPGMLSRADFNDNIPLLEKLLREIVADPSASTLAAVHEQWQEGSFRTQKYAVVNRVFAASDPDHLTSMVDSRSMKRVQIELQKQFLLPLTRSGNWIQDNHNLLGVLKPLLRESWTKYELNTSLWHFYDQISAPNNQQEQPSGDRLSQEPNSTDSDLEHVEIAAGTNTIFYGPPGTGKTYHIVEAAVKAAEPTYTDFDNREHLKKAYDLLVKKGQIRFVTFHQSYSYEEFVEGLRANTDETGQVSYAIEPGIFKQICEDAAVGGTEESGHLEQALEQFISDLRESDPVTLQTKTGKSIRVAIHGTDSFRITPSESTYDKIGKGYSLPFQHIRYAYRNINQQKIYYPSYAKAVLRYIMSKYQIAEYQSQHTDKEHKSFVLVIDEINRGNISKIFGELITLIEPSKRAGQPEALSVSLPYSKDTFTVPSNLHIIGTMNTADRSLAMMDTALRRRFDFREMMPDYTLLDSEEVHKVNLGRLLKVMNDRIEYLYDREHTLGHAFFMPITELESEDERFQMLKSVFSNKVLPLLEEYFFEDWEKIRLVLGDNQKRDENLQFIVRSESSPHALFGTQFEDHSVGERVQYKVNIDAFESPEAYRLIADKTEVNAGHIIENV